MNAITQGPNKSAHGTPQDMHPTPDCAIASHGSGADATNVMWIALHDAAAAVAALAGIEPEAPNPEIRNFPLRMRDAGVSRSRLAENGIADLTAMMKPGLTALLAIRERGADPAPAALSLWREFHAACAAILELAPPGSEIASNGGA